MFFYISCLIMIFVVLICLFCLIFPIHLSIKQLIGLWMFYIVALALMGFHIKPSFSLDLYRMYMEIDGFRAGTRMIFDSAMFICNFLYWLVSKTNNNGWIVFISVIIWGICIKEILKKYLNENRCYSTRAVILYFLAANGGCFIIYLLSGTRCSLAAAIWCYAYYVLFDEKRGLYYLVAGLTIFIHAFGLILFGLTALFHFLQRKKSIFAYIATFTFIVICGYLINTVSGKSLLISLGTTYFDYLADKFQAYSIRGYEYQQKRELMFRILSSLYLFGCLIYLHFKRITKYEIVGFFILIMFAGFNMSILFERMPYVLGICALPIINESIMQSKSVGKLAIEFIGAVILGTQVLWGVYEISLWIDFIV